MSQTFCKLNGIQTRITGLYPTLTFLVLTFIRVKYFNVPFIFHPGIECIAIKQRTCPVYQNFTSHSFGNHPCYSSQLFSLVGYLIRKIFIGNDLVKQSHYIVKTFVQCISELFYFFYTRINRQVLVNNNNRTVLLY